MQQNLKEAKELAFKLNEIISSLEERSDHVKKIKNMEAVFSELIKEQESDRVLIDNLMNEIKEKNEKIVHYQKVLKRISATLKDINEYYHAPIKKQVLDV